MISVITLSFFQPLFAFHCPPISMVKNLHLSYAKLQLYVCRHNGRHVNDIKWFLSSEAFHFQNSEWNLTFFGDIPTVNDGGDALYVANKFIQQIPFDDPKPVVKNTHVYCYYFNGGNTGYDVAAESPPDFGS